MTAQAMALRARIVLACAGGTQNKAVAARLGVCQPTVGKWRARFAEQRMEGLRDKPRPGAPRMVDDERIEALVTATLESVPKDATYWSSRGMARASGLSVSTVQRVWRAFGLQPHRSETFTLSAAPAADTAPWPPALGAACLGSRSAANRVRNGAAAE